MLWSDLLEQCRLHMQQQHRQMLEKTMHELLHLLQQHPDQIDPELLDSEQLRAYLADAEQLHIDVSQIRTRLHLHRK